MEIKFITSNVNKAQTLQSYFNSLGRSDVSVTAQGIDIVEPQCSKVSEVSFLKAREAQKSLGGAVVVEDGGVAIEALNGFPGVYTRYAVDTIGAEGIIRLMHGIENRKVRFVSTTTYVSPEGEVEQFHLPDAGGFYIAYKASEICPPFIWSDIWKVIYSQKYGRILSELGEEEVNNLYLDSQADSTLNQFARWLSKKHPREGKVFKMETAYAV